MRKRYCTAPLAYNSPPPVTTKVGVRLEVLTLLGDCATGALALSDEPPSPPAASFRPVDGIDVPVGAAGAEDDRHAGDDAMRAVKTTPAKTVRSMLSPLDTALLRAQGAAERGRPRSVADEHVSNDFAGETAVFRALQLVVAAKVREMRGRAVRHEPLVEIVGRLVLEVVERAGTDRVLDDHP